MKKGFLARFFGLAKDSNTTNHWAALQTYMEQSFGPIRINVPIEGGSVQAFFERQTLVGDSDLLTNRRSREGIFTLDMKEPIGYGKSHDVAIVDLWEEMTTLDPSETILQLEEVIGNGEMHALYKRFAFQKGRFIDKGAAYEECPPDRPQLIQEFFVNEVILRMRTPPKAEVLGHKLA